MSLLCLLASFLASAQTKITGKVFGRDDGQPLIGATVKVKGTTNGASTDANGTFSLSVTRGNVLVVSSIGYESQEVAVTDQTSYDITLEPSATSLNEVVVTGYSSERRKDITGSVAVVDVEAFAAVPSGSTSQLLQGQASGVTVIAQGAPGSNANIMIRGVTSFGNTQPLVIVDGVQGNLNDLNPNDIASIQILKDAGAASIYGVRGANGVVVVTTKRGKTGAPIVTYDAYYGVQQPLSGNVWDLMSPTEMQSVYARVNPNDPVFGRSLPEWLYMNNANGQGGYGRPGIAGDDPSRYDQTRYRFDAANVYNNYQIAQVNRAGTDWFHEVFKTAPQQSHTLSASGGTENSNYLFSVNYLNQQGTLIETYLKRYAVRVNTSFNIGKRIRIGESAYLFNRTNPGFPGGNQDEGNPISYTYRTLNMIPVYDIGGNFAGTRLGTAEIGQGVNPVAQMKLTNNNRQNNWNMTGNVFGEVDIITGLTARTTFGGTINNNYFSNFGYTPYYNREGFDSPNTYYEASLYNSNWTWTNTLSYSELVGQHNLKLLAGTEAVNGYGREVGGRANGLFSNDFNYLILGNGTRDVTNYSQVNQNARLFSVFGRLDYTFADKYIVGATIRRDGASVFGENSRYGTFPSVSLGWRMSEESFLKNVTWLDDLKLRGSYGIMGNYVNVNYQNPFTLFNQGFGQSYYAIGGANNSTVQGFFQSGVGNPDTGWEENIVTNAGFDVTFLNNQFTFSAEWYKKSINGLLFRQLLPATAGGASAPIVNLGDIKNTGFDVTAGYNGGQNGTFKYNVTANITTYNNEVVAVPGGFFDASNSRLGFLVRNAVGRPVGSFFGYEVAGIFQNQAEVDAAPPQTEKAVGRFRYRDINGDGAITPDDRSFFGDPNPDFTYGLNLGASYKQFDISTILYGSQGNEAINYVRYWTDFMGTFIGGKSHALMNAWSPSNPNSSTPIAETANTFSTTGVFNSYYLEDASFLKMRSLQIGYTLPTATMSRFGIKKLRVYAQGANLFTITKYSGLDPELTPSGSNLNQNGQQTAAFGIDYGNYPNNQKSFLLGVNLSF
ncbi:MAG TPA: TonB-dependent receptor [Sphingobacteriaceae bacterium]